MIHVQLTQKLQEQLPQARIEAICLPTVEEIKLWLINADFPTHGLSADQAEAVMRNPNYWIFCWASGLVLARYILDHASLFAGKRVIDFGAGSAVAGIAAKLAGAREVIACDIDPMAIEVAKANADLNHVDLSYALDFFEIQGPIDIIIVADVLYDSQNLPWLDRFIARSPLVYVADSRVKNFNVSPYQLIYQQISSTVPDLDEFDEFRNVRVYRAARSAG